jgi:hypothetical protein
MTSVINMKCVSGEITGSCNCVIVLKIFHKHVHVFEISLRYNLLEPLYISFICRTAVVNAFLMSYADEGFTKL